MRPLNNLLNESSAEYYRNLLHDLEYYPIRAFAWHNYRGVFALVHRQNTVHLYNLSSDGKYLLFIFSLKREKLSVKCIRKGIK